MCRHTNHGNKKVSKKEGKEEEVTEEEKLEDKLYRTDVASVMREWDIAKKASAELSIIDYQKPTELKIFLNNGKTQHHIMYTIDRFERSVWLLNNNEEEMLTTLMNARLITVSAIGRSGKEYLLKFAVYPKKFMKEKEWLYTCMERDKNQLKYIKKTTKYFRK